MFRSIVLALSLTAASGFMGAPVAHRAARSSSTMKMAFETEIGAQQPLGFWDPLGLLENADQVTFSPSRCPS